MQKASPRLRIRLGVERERMVHWVEPFPRINLDVQENPTRNG